MEWITKAVRRGVSSKADCSIAIVKNRNDNDVTFTIRNGMAKVISDTEYIKLAIDGNRIYFAEAGVEGYKMCARGTKDSVFIKLHANWEKFERFMKKYGSDFTLNYDQTEHAHYIEGNR